MQDSNFRFYAGSFGVLGAFVALAATNLKKYQQTLNLVFLAIIVGGLTRLTVGDVDTLLEFDVAFALVVEIGVIGLLFFWVRYEVGQPPADTQRSR